MASHWNHADAAHVAPSTSANMHLGSQQPAHLAQPHAQPQCCTGFRVHGSPEFDQLCTVISKGFGTITAEYWSALNEHGGHGSYDAAKRHGDAAFVGMCEEASTAYEAARQPLYTADPKCGSLRSTLCTQPPVVASRRRRGHRRARRWRSRRRAGSRHVLTKK